MKKLFVALLFTSILPAQEDVLLVRQADAYYEAKEFDKAYDLYASLVKENLEPWQEARLQYNLGTILLSKGDPAGALELFTQLQFSVEGSPYLTRALQTNPAILNFRIARAVLSNKDAGIEDYSRAFYNLRSALAHTEKAERAECGVQALKGRDECRSAQDLLTLRKAIKNQLASVLDRYGESKISAASVKEGIPFLISGTNLAESHLDFFESIPKDHPLRQKYRDLFVRDLYSWDILWDSLEGKLEELQDPYLEYQQAVQAFQEEEIDQSRLAFLDVEAKLSKMMEALWGEDPLKDLLRKLLVSYRYALDQVPVQPSTLYQLLKEQLRIEEVVEDGLSSLEFLEFSNQQLQSSLAFAREGKRELARYFLEEAKQWIRRLLRSETPGPEEVLEASIEDQVHALTLNLIQDRIAEEQEKSISILNGAQIFTLQTTQPFIDAVLEKQLRDWPETCQCKPWNRVIPLFVKGEQSALEAERLLKLDPDDALAMRKQEEAIKYWKDALHHLRHPEEEEEEEKKEEEKEEETPPPPPEEEEQKEPIDEVMRQLQQMHRDDQQPKSDSQQIQKGIRPW